jgi:hypothetical protein
LYVGALLPLPFGLAFTPDYMGSGIVVCRELDLYMSLNNVSHFTLIGDHLANGKKNGVHYHRY